MNAATERMHVCDRARLAAAGAAMVLLGVCAGAQVMPPGNRPEAEVARSNDVAWLEKVAASASFARQAQGAAGMEKSLRALAYARLGAIGTPESLAAVSRIERTLDATSLTPTTVPLGTWPTVAWHMSDEEVAPGNPSLATAPPVDGVTYAVVAASLLGRYDLFLISTRTPADTASWSRPKLIGPLPRDRRVDNARLAWSAPRALTYITGREQTRIAVDEVERDSDGDGWTDVEEARIGTDAHSVDTDGDGIPDGRDVCPLFAKPPAPDDRSTLLQTALFAAFALSGSRQMLYVEPGVERVHLAGYGGPVLFDRAIPANGNDGGAVYVSWKIERSTKDEARVQVTDWEGMLAAGGREVTLKRIAGRWVVVAVRSTWVS